MVSKAVPRTKSEVLAHIAAETGLHRRQVAWVLDSMNGMIDKSLKREGVFAIPGLVNRSARAFPLLGRLARRWSSGSFSGPLFRALALDIGFHGFQ